jgi:hypothetical protein
MRTLSKLALVIAAVGCGGSSPSLAPHPEGYAGHMQAADAHDQRAEQHRQAAGAPDAQARIENYQCGDRFAMSDQLTSGGQRIMPMVPCWDPVEEHAQRERAAARREELRAQQERRVATEMIETKLAACAGISDAELGHSPFAHRRAIAAVLPHSVGGAIRGVRIVFKPVLGLSAEWLEQAIACHRAEFERLGEPPTYLSDDPTLVHGATATVSSHRGHLEVVVETRDDVAANVALGRARDLVAPRTAGR